MVDLEGGAYALGRDHMVLAQVLVALGALVPAGLIGYAHTVSGPAVGEALEELLSVVAGFDAAGRVTLAIDVLADHPGGLQQGGLGHVEGINEA